MTITTQLNVNFFDSKTEYLAFISAWKQLAQKKQNSFHEHILYTLLRGRMLSYAFSPVKNKNKLANNCNKKEYYNISRGLYYVGMAILYDRYLRLEKTESVWNSLSDNTKTKFKEFLKNFVYYATKENNNYLFFGGVPPEKPAHLQQLCASVAK